MSTLAQLLKSSERLYAAQKSLIKSTKSIYFQKARKGPKDSVPNTSAVDYWHKYYGYSLQELLKLYDQGGNQALQESNKENDTPGDQDEAYKAGGIKYLQSLGLEPEDAKHISAQAPLWLSPESNPKLVQPKLETDTKSKRKQVIRSTEQREKGEAGAVLPSGTAGALRPEGEAARLALGQLADGYVASMGLPKLDHATLPGKTFDKGRATEMARIFELMQHEPNNPEVRRAYDAFINQTKDQWDLIRKFIHPKTGKPIVFEPYHTYADIKNYHESPRKMLEDLHENGHLWYFPTSFGFGPGESQKDTEGLDNPLGRSIYPEGHPEAPAGHKGHFTANDMFRIVHDVMGHGLVGSTEPSSEPGHEGTEPWKGYSFGAQGEEAAYQHHRKMYTPEARMAMTQELRGQNSWVNYGPYGQRNRQRFDKDSGGTEYAAQKTGVWPEEYS